MAQDKQTASGSPRGIIKAMDTRIAEIVAETAEWANKYKLKLLRELGVGDTYYTCKRCNKVLQKDAFYVSTEPGNNAGLTHICKKCAADIAMPTIDGTQQAPTKDTVDKALRALNKPLLEKVWEGSLLEAANTVSGKQKDNVWTSYIKNVQMHNFNTMTYEQSDGYTGGNYSIEQLKKSAEISESQEVIEQFEKNKKDALNLLGYLPFESEKLSDQPFLYSELIGYLDASPDGNDDRLRVQSIITIVRGFQQIRWLDDAISAAMQDPKGPSRNVANIKAYEAMKRDINFTITKLAEQSCISLKHSKDAKKGENTWTGKIKKIKELNLREGEINGFDIDTCRGMQQVLDMSNASIMKQLALDDSEWSDIVAELRENNTSLTKERDVYQEISRILLRENLDLKDLFESNKIPIKHNLVDLEQLFSPLSSVITEEDNVDETAKV